MWHINKKQKPKILYHLDFPLITITIAIARMTTNMNK